VDLVISDIMMPVMDGCELCNTIKNDLRTSHIVVILLTAAIGTTNHIKSLRAGADGYIEKPFRMELLRENVHNLFRNREIRNEQFASSPLSHFRCASYSSVEQDFMDALNNYIFEHISDTEMSADRLASALNTTRKILAHKISANTGLTVNEYVRTCRLKKAAELLAKQKYRINEVGYLVGYSTPSYFTKHFTAQFGMKPSDFVRTL
ncbi:MAG: helix-turn-helix domain-containing protein, partial [Bacteroidales bacterium]|nr:helix-turn-helix domain-containing protein [Bacteroidales bacterium]